MPHTEIREMRRFRPVLSAVQCEVGHCVSEGVHEHHITYASGDRPVERKVRLCEQHHKEITDAHSRMTEKTVRRGNRIFKTHQKLSDEERISFDRNS